MTLDEMEARLQQDPRFLAWKNGTYVSPRYPGRPVPFDMRGAVTFQHDNPDLLPSDGRWSIDTGGEDVGTYDRGMSPAQTALLTAGVFGGPLLAGALAPASAPSLAGIEGGSFGLPASVAGQLPGAVAAPSMVGATAGTGASGFGSFLANNKNWLGAALGAGAGLVGRMTNPGVQPIPVPPELQQLLTEATRRQMNQGPLADAVTQQALAGLPNYARGGR